MNITEITSGKSSSDQSRYTTDAFAPSASSLVLIFVTNARAIPLFGSPSTATMPVVSRNGSPLQRVTTVIGGKRTDLRLSCFRLMEANPASVEVEITFGEDTQDLCLWSVVEFTDVDATSALGANAIAQNRVGTGNGTSIEVQLVPSSDAGHNATIGAVVLDVGGSDPSRTITAGTGFAELGEVSVNQTLARRTVMQTQTSTTNPGGVSWSWTGNEDSLAIAVEVKATPSVATLPTDPTEALIRRFEPILFLHPDEDFFPSDAKRYIESASLWGSTAPFGDKRGWTLRVPAGQLVASQSEQVAGTQYLGDAGNLANSAGEMRFLDLGGWKNEDDVHEDTVSTTTSNSYADRDTVIRLYRGGLESSQFWYHAEVYDSTRLTALASTVVAPNLSRLLVGITDPTLLCYYFFFPAHDQPVGGDSCPNIEAREAYGHAGDWQCVALLLEGDGTGEALSYSPRFFGCTGSRPEPAAGVPPLAGDDDSGGYTVMRVMPWRTGSATAPLEPELDGEHPRFYVARGSHSLHTTAGAFAVAPEVNPSLNPAWCARLDDSSPIPGAPGPNYRDASETLAALVVKMASTGFFGFAWVGLAWAFVEMISDAKQPFGSDDTQPTGVSPTPEQAAPTDQAITIRPSGLTVAGSGPVVHDWRVQQGFQENNRTYDFVVDRRTQIWWPSDDLTSNFRGRWGQQVADDVRERRNGPHFLQFWKMFLTAMAGA